MVQRKNLDWKPVIFMAIIRVSWKAPRIYQVRGTMFGQRRTIIEHSLFLGPFLLPTFMYLLVFSLSNFGRASVFALLIGLVGSLFIAMSKMKGFKRFEFISFGPKNMGPSERRNYFIGYALVSVSLVISAIVTYIAK